MEMWKLIVNIVAMLIVLLGVIMVFDARVITRKMFSFGDQNSATRWMKIIGLLMLIIGAGIIIFL